MSSNMEKRMMLQYYTQKEALDEYVESERAEAAREGNIKGKKDTALNLHAMGMADEFIAKAVQMSLTTVKGWLYPATAN